MLFIHNYSVSNLNFLRKNIIKDRKIKLKKNNNFLYSVNNIVSSSFSENYFVNYYV